MISWENVIKKGAKHGAKTSERRIPPSLRARFFSTPSLSIKKIQ